MSYWSHALFYLEIKLYYYAQIYEPGVFNNGVPDDAATKRKAIVATVKMVRDEIAIFESLDAALMLETFNKWWI